MGDFSAIYLVYIWIGAGIGASIRWLLSDYFSRTLADISLGTLLANLLGAFLIGLFYQLSYERGWSEEVKLALIVGGLGSLTTFSAFSLESWQLASGYQTLWFFGHILLHVAGCLVMVSIGD